MVLLSTASAAPAPAAMMIHVLVFPFPAQGHINPLLLFSSHLALHGCTITFVNTDASQQYMLNSPTARTPPPLHSDPPCSHIRFLTIPHCLPPHMNFAAPTSMESLLLLVEGVKQQQEALEQIVEDSMSTASPISYIVSDSFFPWTLDVAKKFGIPRALFWTGNATTFYMNLLVASGIHNLGESWEDTPESPLHPGLSFLHRDVINSFCLNSSPIRLRFLNKRFQDIQDNGCILINSFYELEGSMIHAAPLNVPIRCVGQLLLPSNDKLEERGIVHQEEDQCLEWLDKQPTSSVLYISFGSIASLSMDQLIELAFGIEASGQSFLWVIRSETQNDGDLLPKGFRERTADRGIVISWAPQLRVLSHSSVGAFLTHCGWNSTVESIAMGVPMLCWPIFAEQPLNCRMIVKQWKVGFEFWEGDTPTKPRREDVESIVREAMQGENGRMVRQRVGELRDAIQASIRQLGSSLEDILCLLQGMHCNGKLDVS